MDGVPSKVGLSTSSGAVTQVAAGALIGGPAIDSPRTGTIFPRVTGTNCRPLFRKGCHPLRDRTLTSGTWSGSRHVVSRACDKSPNQLAQYAIFLAGLIGANKRLAICLAEQDREIGRCARRQQPRPERGSCQQAIVSHKFHDA